jgi:hypothetical protein
LDGKRCCMITGMRDATRPEWAAAGTFAEAWRSAKDQAENFPHKDHRELAQITLKALSIARVVSVDEDQELALPPVDVSYLDSNLRLPFDLVYLSLNDRLCTAYSEEDDELELHYEPEGRFESTNLAGALVISSDAAEEGRLTIIPFLHFKTTDHAPTSGYMGTIAIGGENRMTVRVGDFADDYLNEGREALKNICGHAAGLVLRVIYFLESTNVELVEGEASRQEKRHVARKGGRIALTVKVREPKRRPRTDGEAQHVDYSHRWEVRGHYKHFPAGTKLADAAPQKLVKHPTLGQCRRIWCPPHVKGPANKPLVPKVRIVA